MDKITNRHMQMSPELYQKYNTYQKKTARRDVGYHLDYFAQSLLYESPELFCDYTQWLKVYLPGLGIKEKDILDNLKCLKEVVSEEVPEEYEDRVSEYAEKGIRHFKKADPEIPSFLNEDAKDSVIAAQYMNSLLRGDRRTAAGLIMKEADSGRTIPSIYTDIIQPVQYEVGRLWQTHKISVAQEHFCSAAAQLIMSQLYPNIFSGEVKNKTIVVHCVSEELHEIGARMLADFFEIEGWNTIYLGANTPAGSVAEMIKERDADLLGISATMTFHIPKVEEVIREVRASDKSHEVKIMVGGYPFQLNPELWKKVGADGWAPDAMKALETAARLVSEPSESRSPYEKETEISLPKKESRSATDYTQKKPEVSLYDELTRLNNELSQAQRELARKKAEVERLSVTDPLTEVYNRRGFFRAAERDFERSVRFERPLAVLMLDIDHFKKINDQYGHPAGDKILSETAGILKQEVRSADLVGRYGGEEFVVLLVETEPETGRNVAERLRKSIQEYDFRSESQFIKVTVSIGMAPFCEKCSDLQDLVERADQALYRAKESGRNRVEVS